MNQSLQTLIDAPIIELDTIDSTNNYAMRLIDADTAQAGLTIISQEQTHGKGQRGRHWQDARGESLLMSIICPPSFGLEDQFVFNASVTVAIADVISQLSEALDVRIKWPNDIIINDKKAGGILIENILRGNKWHYSIIGLGLNIGQPSFSGALPFATSLKIATGKDFSLTTIFHEIRKNILKSIASPDSAVKVMTDYNDYLYRSNCLQKFINEAGEWTAIVQCATRNGLLQVMLNNGEIAYYTHGTVQWQWE